MSNLVQVFKHEEFGQVRIEKVDGCLNKIRLG